MIYTVLSENYKILKTTTDYSEAENILKKQDKAFQILEQKDKYANATIIKRKSDLIGIF